jgi:hypothetical protein
MHCYGRQTELRQQLQRRQQLGNRHFPEERGDRLRRTGRRLAGNSVLRPGRLLATKAGIAPGQKALFQFNQTIWIGVVSQVVQGEIMNSAITSNINTEFSLLGIASADIVMTGGGSGANSTPFTFNLANIVMA